MEYLTSPEVADAIESGMRTAVLPLGATEQHGPHLPLAMDALLADHPEAHGGLALLIGFGAGLSYAAQVVRLPDAP